MPAEKVEILTDNGTTVKAIAPVIISASRSTDIPAYFPKWFATRFNGGRGYVKWFNPFNQKPVFVSFEKTKVIVFWTKNPKPLIPYLPQLDAAGVHYYFHFTLNDYQQENLEPNVPSLESRIQTFTSRSSLPYSVRKESSGVLIQCYLLKRSRQESSQRGFSRSAKNSKAVLTDWCLVSSTSRSTKRFREIYSSTLSTLPLNTIQPLSVRLNRQQNKSKSSPDTFRRFALTGKSADGTWRSALAQKNSICLTTEYFRASASMLN